MLEATQQPELIEYRAVSRLAVAGLALGLASPLALISPLLWPLPAVGILVNIAALVHIERDSAAVIGRKAALVGLLLSVLFLAAAPARMFSRRYWLSTRAQQFGGLWFQLLREGKDLHAYELKLPPEARQPVTDDPNRPTDEEGEEELAVFLTNPVVAALLQMGPKAEVRHVGSEFPDDTHVTLNYEINAPPDAKSVPRKVRLLLERLLDTGGQEQWRIADIREQ